MKGKLVLAFAAIVSGKVPCGRLSMSSVSDFQTFCDSASSVTISSSQVGNISVPTLELLSSQNALNISHNLVSTSVLFPDLEAIKGEVLIYDNVALETLGFPNLRYLKGGMLVTANDMNMANTLVEPKVQLDLNKLEALQGNLTGYHLKNISLTALSSLDGELSDVSFVADNLREISGRGTLTLENVVLRDLSMEQLETIYGSLYLVNVQGIGNLSGLPMLNTIFGSLIISTKAPLDTYASALKEVRGAMNVTVLGQNQSDSGWNCQKLKQEYLDTGIVKGRFTCKMPGSDYIDENSAAVALLSQNLAVPLLCAFFFVFFY